MIERERKREIERERKRERESERERDRKGECGMDINSKIKRGKDVQEWRSLKLCTDLKTIRDR